MKCQDFTIFRSLIFEAKALFSKKSRVHKGNKRCFRADGLPLHPSALRPRLLGPIVNCVSLFFALDFIILCLFVNPVSAESITLTVPSAPINLDVRPDNTFTKSTASSVSVKTDGLAGYTLSLEAQNGNQLLNGLNHLDTLPEKVNESDYISNSKYNNTWGILTSKLDGANNSDFLPGPFSNTKIIIDKTEDPNKNGDNEYSFTLGAKVDDIVATGIYHNTFILTATVNDIPVPETMQDLVRYDYCNKMTLHQELTLTDTRDGSDYTVSKLADGKCWMTQNLRITGKTITSEDSDLESGSFAIPESNAGRFISTDYNNDAAYDSGNKNTGGYYSWHTATAGADADELANVGIYDASNSICPKGWNLPASDELGNFVALFYNYIRKNYNSYPFDTIVASPGPHFTLNGYQNFDGNFEKNNEDGWYYGTSIATGVSAGTHQTYAPKVLSSNKNLAFAVSRSTNRQNGRTIRCVTGNTPYTITYNSNGDAITKYVNKQAGTTQETTIKLTQEEPTRAGYTFAGWCNKAVTGTNCQSRIYQPGDTLLLGYDNSITLYAMWQQNSLTTLQNFNCASLSTGEVTILTDTRDQNRYAVAKLKDNKCWMTQNLRIGGNTTITLDSSSSDVASNFTLPISAPASSSDMNQAHIYAPGYGSNYGNYYNWIAATANGYTSGDNILYSICPKNWKLPSRSNLETLISYYDKISILQPPANFTVLGTIDASSLFDVSNYGRYWTSTRAYSDNPTDASILRLVPFFIDSHPVSYDWTKKVNEINVRCVTT